MDISLDLVVEAARRRLAALTPEVAGYVVLLAAQRLQPRPSRVSPDGVFLMVGGDVHVRPEPAASELEVEVALRGLLATLLELSPSPAPAITAVAEAHPSGNLQTLSAELSAALIPINHAAAHRALARLYRETVRAQGPVIDTASSPTSPEVRESEMATKVMRPRDVSPTPGAAQLEPPEASAAQSDAVADLTAAPPPVARVTIMGRDLDIDVDLEPDLERAASAVVVSDPRSDLQELLRNYLSSSGSEERMTRQLRAMIHLAGCPPTLQDETAHALHATGPG